MAPRQRFQQIAACRYLLSRPVRRTLYRIVDELVATAAHSCVRQRLLVVLCGYSKCGKTVLRNSHPLLSRLAVIETIPIHERLNRAFPFLQDDRTVTGAGYWPRQVLTHFVRGQAMERLLRSGVAVVSDSCNLRASDRRATVSAARYYGYTTVIIHVECSEAVLLERLAAADAAKTAAGEAPAWVDLYRRVQRSRFEPPEDGETDYLLTFLSGADDPASLTIPVPGQGA